MVFDVLEPIAGGLLLFVLPGFAWSRALFPEWPLRGPSASIRWVETLTLSFLMSVSLTIVIGSALSRNNTLDFSASWSAPTVELLLLVATAAGLVVAAVRGGLSWDGAPGRPTSSEEPSITTTFRDLDRIERDRVRARRALRAARGDVDRELECRHELDRLDQEAREVRERREAQIAD
jgi:hypothetical protein